MIEFVEGDGFAIMKFKIWERVGMKKILACFLIIAIVLAGGGEIYADEGRGDLLYQDANFRANYVMLATMPATMPRASTNPMVRKLVDELTREEDELEERAAKIINWIVDNLYVEDSETIITFYVDENGIMIYDEYYEESRQAAINKLLTSKRGACGHFALLLEDMMGEAGISAPIVSGIADYERTDYGAHLWNIVQLDENLPIDVFWMCGNYWDGTDVETDMRYLYEMLPWALDRMPDAYKTYAEAHSVKVVVNGQEAVDLPALNVGGNNFVKLRSLAAIVDLFAIDYDVADETAFLSKGEYAKVGNELDSIGNKKVVAEISRTLTVLNGEAIPVATYKYMGNNYCKLRDLAGVGFSVDWDESARTILITY
jgi:hypothetical protein